MNLKEETSPMTQAELYKGYEMAKNNFRRGQPFSFDLTGKMFPDGSYMLFDYDKSIENAKVFKSKEELFRFFMNNF